MDGSTDEDAPARVGVTLEALRRGQCRFIVDETSPVRFCGKPTIRGGSSWCAEHYGLVYEKRPQGVRRRPPHP